MLTMRMEDESFYLTLPTVQKIWWSHQRMDIEPSLTTTHLSGPNINLLYACMQSGHNIAQLACLLYLSYGSFLWALSNEPLSCIILLVEKDWSGFPNDWLSDRKGDQLVSYDSFIPSLGLLSVLGNYCRNFLRTYCLTGSKLMLKRWKWV